MKHYVLPELLIRIRMNSFQSKIRIRIEVKIQELWRLKWSHGGPWTLAMKAWRIKLESLDQWSQIRITSMIK
jgi:hypothetical protein